jgi:hypothetical protein
MGEFASRGRRRWAWLYKMPFFDMVSAGLIEGTEPLSFGGNIKSLAAASGEVRFDESQRAPTDLSAGSSLYVVSSSASDTSQVTVHGVNASGDFAIVTATLTGTTPVRVGAADAWNHGQKLISNGAANVGVLYLSAKSGAGAPGASDFVQCQVAIGDRYAINPVLLVPNGWHIAMLQMNFSTAQKVLRIRFWRETIETGVKIKSFQVFMSDGDYEQQFPVPFFLKQGDKLTVTAESTSGTVTEASFGVNGYILKTDDVTADKHISVDSLD